MTKKRDKTPERERERRKTLIIQRSNPMLMPQVHTIMDNALSILNKEIMYYMARVTRGHTLSPSEAKIFSMHINSLTTLSKEDRARLDASDLANMSAEELLEMASKLNLPIPKNEDIDDIESVQVKDNSLKEDDK